MHARTLISVVLIGAATTVSGYAAIQSLFVGGTAQRPDHRADTVAMPETARPSVAYALVKPAIVSQETEKPPLDVATSQTTTVPATEASTRSDIALLLTEPPTAPRGPDLNEHPQPKSSAPPDGGSPKNTGSYNTIVGSGAGGTGGGGGSGLGSGGSGGGGGGAAPSPLQQVSEPQAAPVEEAAPQAGSPRVNLPRAFPSAEGFGAHATGGRGGDVYIVSTLDNSGAGSLRYGIQSAKGPRTIVFQVAGTIYLNSPLSINKPDLTIAGQTAPGDGITLAGQPVYIHTHNLILRHLRVRLGDINAADRPAGNHFGTPVAARAGKGLKNLAGEAGDALSVDQSENVILDHLSVSWGMDETLSITRSVNVTVQDCIIAEGLNDSLHPKGPHGFGSLIVGGANPEGGVTFVRNLYMHQMRRSPGVAGFFLNMDKDGFLKLEFSNNVIYNWGDQAFHVTGTGGTRQVNFSGNLYLPGNNTPNLARRTFDKITDQPLHAQRDKLVTADGTFEDLFTQPPLDKLDPAAPRFLFPDVDRYMPDRLLQWVNNHAGAFMARDAVDLRLVGELKGREGHIIDSQDDVGGFPVLDAGKPPIDSDHDGMPDDWERAEGLDPSDPSDRNNIDQESRTMLEKYLNSLIQYNWKLTDALSMYD